MKKRIIAFFLSVCMIVSLLAQYVPGVSAKEIDPWENPEAYVESVATFNTTNGEDSLSSFHIIGDPASYDYSVNWEDDACWLYNEASEQGKDELPDDLMKLIITDCYDHEVEVSDDEGIRNVRYVWYKVEAAEGYELPEKMSDKPYILYMSSDDYDWGCPPALNFDLIEETAKTEETEESSIDTLDVDDEELVGYVVPEGMISPWENPEAYIGSVATFNTTNGENSLSDFHVFGDPANYDYEKDWLDDTYWLYNESADSGEDELPDDYMQMKIIDCYVHDVATGSGDMKFIWYKVEAAEGYELPKKMSDKPYVLYMTTHEYEVGDPVALNFDFIPETAGDGRPELPDGFAIEKVGLKGYFSEDVVKFYKTPEGTARTEDLNTADLPDFVDVLWLVTDNRVTSHETWYYIGNTQSWAGIENWTDCYVPISHVTLVPAEVTELYEALMDATSVDEFEEIMENADAEILEQLTDKHFASMGIRYEELFAAGTKTKETTVTVDGKEIKVTATGLIPEGVTLEANLENNDTVMSGGFDIQSAEEIVLALDIKMVDGEGNEWQPKAGRNITVSIDMATLGYEDGKLFRLHHKHGDDIEVFEVFVVMDGKLTVTTNGFSIFVISNFNDFNQTNPQENGIYLAEGGNANNPTPIELTVGQTVVYYVTPRTNENAGNYSQTSTWWVEDPDGAIFYEVYSSRSAGSFGVNAQWIRVTALKETETPVLLRFQHTRDINPNSWQNPANTTVRIYEQYFNLNIQAPRARAGVDEDNVKLYIKDEVNTTGRITAALVDTNGNEVALSEDCTFSWERNDDAYIIPMAYEEGGKSINICVDHGGVLQDRLENITYTVTVTLENGREKEASYTVYYQSEILNASFEAPQAQEHNYTFFVNGWSELYWKTTSPGEGLYLSRDVEYARYEPGQNRISNDVNFYPYEPGDGDQFAELNAEKYGALYQDIITAPLETVTWEFEHAKRNEEVNGESMFLIIGPTEFAQEATDYEKISNLINDILEANGGRANALAAMANGESITYVDNDTGAEYKAWYHNAETGSIAPRNAWVKLTGTYTVPSDQYRTRLFFVTDPGTDGKETMYGNLIDSSRAGQYKTYLIEYYEETYELDENGANILVQKHIAEYDEGYTIDSGGNIIQKQAMIYSSVILENFVKMETIRNDLLSTVYINGENSPYNIRYTKDPCLFVENYPTDSTKAQHYDEDDQRRNNYEDYDIVMQVFFRDTIIAVQKWIEFPTVAATGKEALAPDQKKNLIDSLIAENGHGYQTFLDLLCTTEDNHFADGTITITKNDPAGWYTGYIPMGDNPKNAHVFTLTETNVSPLEGLELDNVKFEYYTFNQGVRTLTETAEYINISEVETTTGETTERNLVGNLVGNSSTDKRAVSCEGIQLDPKNSIKIAEIKVTNKYREKQVKINYVAVGNGTVDVQDDKTGGKKEDNETFLYYSGRSKGVVATPDQRYTFAGWYLDEACTVPVNENHGYVDYQDDNTVRFTPNTKKMISDDVLEVTYYAKFSIGSLQIIRENAEPGQVFVYEIKDKNKNVVMYATVVVGEDGKGSTEIVNASFGTDQSVGLDYTITQLNDWSWRHDDTSITQTHKVTEGLHGATDMTTEFVFKEDSINEYWLNGNSTVKVNKYISAGGTD